MSEIIETGKELNTAKDCIIRQWDVLKSCEKAIKREALRMGAMLMSVELILGHSAGGYNTKGCGLKGWIDENLPEEITSSYETLMRWKRAAQAVMNQVALTHTEAIEVLKAKPVELCRMMDSDDASLNGKRAAIEKTEEIVKSKSLNELLLDFRDSQKKPGRKPGQNVDSYKDMKKSPQENAMFAWAKITVEAKHQSLCSMASLLPVNNAAETLSLLKPLVSALEKRVKEGGVMG